MFSQFFLKRSANFLFFSVSFKIINRHALFLKGKGRPADGIVLHIGNQHPAPRRNQRFQNYIERCGGVIKKADPCGIVQTIPSASSFWMWAAVSRSSAAA